MTRRRGAVVVFALTACGGAAGVGCGGPSGVGGGTGARAGGGGGAPALVAPIEPAPPTERADLAVAIAPPASDWAASTFAPQNAPLPDDARQRRLLESCGTPDAALMRIASERPSEVEPRLRQLGSPLVRPRVITVHGGDHGDRNDRAEPRDHGNRGDRGDRALLEELTVRRPPGARCGIAVTGDETTIVRAEGYLDLQPIPVRVRAGQWFTVSAALRTPFADPKVVVVEAHGSPKTFPTSVSAGGGSLRATIVLDRPGAFTLQIIGTTDQSTRPLAEAAIFADVAPSLASAKAPGEDQPTLEEMITSARREERLAPLRRDARLDELARAHVKRMRDAGLVAHDVGDGDLRARFEEAGYIARVIGENVARADSLALAHRALYASPSHRRNLLHDAFDRVGLATLEDSGKVWVCEVFANGLP